MISYLFDAVLLVALIATSVQVAIMYRQLRRLRSHDGDYRKILRETGSALDSIDGAVRDINAHGSQIILTLGERIEDAEALVARLEDALAAAREPLSRHEGAAPRPVLAWSAPEPGQPAYQPPAAYQVVSAHHAQPVHQPRPAYQPQTTYQPQSAYHPEPSARPSQRPPEPALRPRPYTAPPASPAPPAPARPQSSDAPTLGDYLGRWRPARPEDFRRSASRADRP